MRLPKHGGFAYAGESPRYDRTGRSLPIVELSRYRHKSRPGMSCALPRDVHTGPHPHRVPMIGHDQFIGGTPMIATMFRYRRLNDHGGSGQAGRHVDDRG